MEIIPPECHEIATSQRPKRQLVVSPIEWGGPNDDRLILVCIAPHDMQSTPEEEIRLDYENFPAIGVMKPNGEIEVDPSFCIQRGLYKDISELATDLKLLLEANGLFGKKYLNK